MEGKNHMITYRDAERVIDKIQYLLITKTSNTQRIKGGSLHLTKAIDENPTANTNVS